MLNSPSADRPNKHKALSGIVTISTTMVSAFLAACDSANPGDLVPFAQVGDIHVSVETPIHLGLGWIRQDIDWTSDGTWEIREEIGYKDVLGEQSRKPNPGLPLPYAAKYTRVIQLLNDDPNFRLAEIPQLEQTECDGDLSRVTLRIRDASTNAAKRWVRCGSGTLGTLITAGSGPDVEAAKVIQFVQLVRWRTIGPGYRSAYVGSVPFATVEKGTETGWETKSGDRPMVFVFRSSAEVDAKETQDAWVQFWHTHNYGEKGIAPGVDWDTEMVLAGILDTREEVGDSVEIRNVYTVADGTRVEWYERIPGDFCVPAQRTVRPYHIVVAPKGPAPVVFTEIRRDPVPCGT